MSAIQLIWLDVCSNHTGSTKKKQPSLDGCFNFNYNRQMTNLSDLISQASNCVCKKKKALQRYRMAINEWLVQVMIGSDIFGTAYFKNPPIGIPAQLHNSIEDAKIAAITQALERWNEQQSTL